jgi:nitroreductase
MDIRPVSADILLQQLQWRYAVKKFDPARKISPADWEIIEEAISLTPTSYGLQPFRAIVVENIAVRERLVPVSWGQRQVADASHFVVFARKLTMTAVDIDRYLARTAEVRGATVESLAGFRKVLVGDLVEGPRSRTVAEWAAHQAYITLGNLMTCAAMLGIDTCPMEGFEPEKYDAILGLADLRLTSVVACAVGFRAADDKYGAMKKVRLPRAEFISHV